MAIYKTINGGTEEEKKLSQGQNSGQSTASGGSAANQQPQSSGAQKMQPAGDFDYSKYQYDPASDAAYQQALQQLQNAQMSMPVYQATYDQQLNDLYSQIVNRDKFSYNINEDALYQQYKDQYVTQGKLAMQDTMGQAAALTGGYGNSYGQNVGQQAYQGYLQQLNERVPELYGMAYDRYNQEGQDLLNQYAMLGDMADTEYGRYQDALNQYWQQLDYAQGQADAAYDRGFSNWYNAYQQAYQEQRDQAADAKWQAEFDEDKRRYDQEWNLALQEYLGAQGSTGTSTGSSGSGTGGSWDTHGLSTEEIKALQSAAGLRADGIWGPLTEKAYQASLLGDGVFDNGSLSENAVRMVQASLGVPQTGKWDAQTMAAAGGLDADAAYKQWNQGKLGKSVVKEQSGIPDASQYADWDAEMWYGYFVQIRQMESSAAAEEELNRLIKAGAIPKNMISTAVVGAKGSMKGH